MTHDQIAEFVASRLQNKMGYKVAFSNITCAGARELPDVLAFTHDAKTLLGEVKVSRSDFFADLKKSQRVNGSTIGNERVYITPKGLLKVDEIPYGWMLWEVSRRGKTKVLSVAKGRTKMTVEYPSWKTPGAFDKRIQTGYKNTDAEEYWHFYNSSNFDCGKLLIRIMSRMQISGIDVARFARNKQSTGRGESL